MTSLPEIAVLAFRGKTKNPKKQHKKKQNPRHRGEASALLVTPPAAGSGLLITLHVANENVLEESSNSVIGNAI